jgi:hypothetical protein
MLSVRMQVMKMQSFQRLYATAVQLLGSQSKLFGGQSKHLLPLVPADIDAESALMQALAEVEAEAYKDTRPDDDGAVEIVSENEYIK